MQVKMAEIYNDNGQVLSCFSESISGYKKCLPLANGLSLTLQKIKCKNEVTFTETAHGGVYFSVHSDKVVALPKDFSLANIRLLEESITESFTLEAGECRSLLQLHCKLPLLAQALNEPLETVKQHLKISTDKLASDGKTISFPITQKLANTFAPLMQLSTEKRLSLCGQTYAFSFLLLEQMQILSHMLSCSDCQSKLFTVQNLLEADCGVTKELTEFAYQAGLNVEALELGFHHLVGVTIEAYRDQIRLKRVATMLRTENYSRTEIAQKTGVSGERLDSLFIQYFGVSIAEYGQLH